MVEQAHPSHEELVESLRPTLKYALTVHGPVREDKMGIVLPHEHILVDLRTYHEPFYPELEDSPVELSMLGRLRRHQPSCLDNLILDDVGLATSEIIEFARAGGSTLVDLTSRGPRINLDALPQLAQSTGLNIIVGTGLYAPRFYSESLVSEGGDSLAEQFARDVEEGIDGTQIKAGVIGQLCIEDLSDPGQEKVLRAGVRASVRTGAPLAIDCPPGEVFDAVHRLLGEEHVPPTKVLLCGMDRDMAQDERKCAADRGYYLLFDGFGKEWWIRGGERRIPVDPERLRWLKELIEAGYLRQLLISQGIDRKMLLVRYGGWGYAHIIRHILPMMAYEKFAPKEITTLTMHNPARALAFLS